MRIKWEHLGAIYKEAKKIRLHLNRTSQSVNAIPVSLDDLTDAIKEIYGFDIEVRLVEFDSTSVRGMIEIYDNRAIITIDAEANLHDTRYVFAKEVCHIVVLSKDNETKDPGAIIDYYVHNRPETDNGAHPEDVICEEVTKHGAVELLFPPPLRQSLKEEIAAGTTTVFKIAEKLQIPQHLIEFALEDTHMDNSARLRDEPAEPER